MRTRLSICQKKQRYISAEQAQDAASKAGIILYPYLCDRCRKYHLTSRTKGRRFKRPS